MNSVLSLKRMMVYVTKSISLFSLTSFSMVEILSLSYVKIHKNPP